MLAGWPRFNYYPVLLTSERAFFTFLSSKKKKNLVENDWGGKVIITGVFDVPSLAWWHCVALGVCHRKSLVRVINTHIHTHIRARAHAHTRALTHAHIGARTHSRKHPPTHLLHTHTHTHTHTHLSLIHISEPTRPP